MFDSEIASASGSSGERRRNRYRTTSRNAAVTGSARIAPSNPASDPPTMIAKTTAARVELDRVALDLRHEDVVLDLLDEEVQEQGREDRDRTDGRREQHGRHRRQDGADDRDELEHAGDDRQEDAHTVRRSGR